MKAYRSVISRANKPVGPFNVNVGPSEQKGDRIWERVFKPRRLQRLSGRSQVDRVFGKMETQKDRIRHFRASEYVKGMRYVGMTPEQRDHFDLNYAWTAAPPLNGVVGAASNSYLSHNRHSGDLLYPKEYTYESNFKHYWDKKYRWNRNFFLFIIPGIIGVGYLRETFANEHGLLQKNTVRQHSGTLNLMMHGEHQHPGDKKVF